MTKPRKLFIVLPAFNEEKALPALLESLDERLAEHFSDFRLFLVDDGSSDRTAEIAEAFSGKGSLSVLRNPKNLGLAESLKRGLIAAAEQASPRDLIVTMDADNTHPAGLILRMVRQIDEGCDVVIASRYREGSYSYGVPLDRRVLSYGASWLFRAFFPTPGVRDYTCGFRIYRASLLKELMERYGSSFISERGFSCMLDLLLRMRELQPVISEVPLVLRYDRKQGRSKMNVGQTITDSLRLLVRRRFFES